MKQLSDLILYAESFLRAAKEVNPPYFSEGSILKIERVTTTYGQAQSKTRPSHLFTMKKDKGVFIDCDTYVNPELYKADAYVLTDKGIHLFYFSCNEPTGHARYYLCDPAYVSMNKDKDNYPFFFLSKNNLQLRRQCISLTHEGTFFAQEYNYMATRFCMDNLSSLNAPVTF